MPVHPSSAPAGDPAICPHCWMVNPGPFNLCARCGADMRTFLQESGGLRRTAPMQSPTPVEVRGRLSRLQRGAVWLFLVVLALGYLSVFFLPADRVAPAGERPAPAPEASGG